MKNLKKQRRIQVIILMFIALGLSVALIGYGLRDGINYFRSPSQVLQDPPDPSEIFRIGGLIEEGSIVRGSGQIIKFIVTDTNARVQVEFNGILPDLFAENQGMIGTGNYINNTFQASEILAKHDEKYMPKEVVDMLKEQGVFQPATD
ncbi:MAG: cytochrome c maturation protein CcmE [Paracoccaceae bacterium]|nr:cytochrome c maturation protein CcmE [Paracoccaceae bacterium]